MRLGTCSACFNSRDLTREAGMLAIRVVFKQRGLANPPCLLSSQLEMEIG